MSSKVSVVTISNHRPEALQLCQRWFAHQDYCGPTEHIIEEGRPFNENLAAALKRVSGDVVVFMEDDDYYRPFWLTWCVGRLQSCELAGQEGGKFYHLPSGGYATRGKNPEGKTQTWMMASAVRACVVPRLIARAEGAGMSDAQLWAPSKDKRLTPGDGFVSLKGVPGRDWYHGGALGKHSAEHQMWRDHDDERRTVLKKWIGDKNHAEAYLSLL